MLALSLSSRRASSARSSGASAAMATGMWSVRAARTSSASARPASERCTRVTRWSLASARRSTRPAVSIERSMRLSVGGATCMASARVRCEMPS